MQRSFLSPKLEAVLAHGRARALDQATRALELRLQRLETWGELVRRTLASDRARELEAVAQGPVLVDA
jgi:hypothetical protein